MADVVSEHPEEIHVYENDDGNIVIRQAILAFEPDGFVAFTKDQAKEIAEKILALAE